MESIHAHHSFLALTGSYYHQCFLRGIPEITCLIRRTPSGTRLSSDGEPPDFDAISREFPIGVNPTLAEVPSNANVVNLESNPFITRPSDANVVNLESNPFITRPFDASIVNLDSNPSITRAGDVREAALRHETSYGIELANQQLELQNMQQHQAQELATHQLGLPSASLQYQVVLHSGLPGEPMPDELANQQLELQNMQHHQAQRLPTHQLSLRSTSPQYQDTVMDSGLPGVPLPDELANDLLQYYQFLDDSRRTNQGGGS